MGSYDYTSSRYSFGYGNDSNGSWYPSFVPFCSRIQTYPVNNRILLWDLILFIPNALFILFLLFKWYQVKDRFRLNNFPILSIFYNLILLVSLLSLIRCLVSTFIKPTDETGMIINKIFWLIVRFSQLSTELSVVFFGLFFGRLDSKKSIYRIMALTIPISLIYIIIQGILEFVLNDQNYIIADKNNHYFDLYGHGGMVFWFASSTIFVIIYTGIVILPHTRMRNVFPLPTKRSFYVYCGILAILSAAQSIGSAITYVHFGHNGEGLCILDSTTYIYFTLFCPLVYLVFLKKFFKKQSNMQKNESTNLNGDETEVSIQSPSRRSVLSRASTNVPNMSINTEIVDTSTANLIGQRAMPQAHTLDINSYSSFRDEFNFIRNNFDPDGSIDEEHYYLNNEDVD